MREIKKGNIGKVKEKTREYTVMEISLKKNYSAISRNGDTLELSGAGGASIKKTNT